MKNTHPSNETYNATVLPAFWDTRVVASVATHATTYDAAYAAGLEAADFATEEETAASAGAE